MGGLVVILLKFSTNVQFFSLCSLQICKIVANYFLIMIQQMYFNFLYKFIYYSLQKVFFYCPSQESGVIPLSFQETCRVGHTKLAKAKLSIVSFNFDLR